MSESGVLTLLLVRRPDPHLHTNLLNCKCRPPPAVSLLFFPPSRCHIRMLDLRFFPPLFCVRSLEKQNPGSNLPPMTCYGEKKKTNNPALMTRSLISRGKPYDEPGFTSPADLMLSRCGPADCLPSELAQSSLLLRRQEDGITKDSNRGAPEFRGGVWGLQ